MSFPQIQTKIELSDYILVEVVGGPETRYKIYKKDNYSEHPVDTSLAEILIPYYCGEPKVKLGAFLPQFDKILCELLVVADRENVSRLFSETLIHFSGGAESDEDGMSYYEEDTEDVFFAFEEGDLDAEGSVIITAGSGETLEKARRAARA